jgi:hypothetical protein
MPITRVTEPARERRIHASGTLAMERELRALGERRDDNAQDRQAKGSGVLRRGSGGHEVTEIERAPVARDEQDAGDQRHVADAADQELLQRRSPALGALPAEGEQPVEAQARGRPRGHEQHQVGRAGQRRSRENRAGEEDQESPPARVAEEAARRVAKANEPDSGDQQDEGGIEPVHRVSGGAQRHRAGDLQGKEDDGRAAEHPEQGSEVIRQRAPGRGKRGVF